MKRRQGCRSRVVTAVVSALLGSPQTTCGWKTRTVAAVWRKIDSLLKRNPYRSNDQMQITKEQAQEIRELLEDTVEYYCDSNLMSGELIWNVVECLALAKQAEFAGLVTAD